MIMILNCMWVLVGSTASIGKFGFWLHEDSASYNFFLSAVALPFHVTQIFFSLVCFFDYYWVLAYWFKLFGWRCRLTIFLSRFFRFYTRRTLLHRPCILIIGILRQMHQKVQLYSLWNFLPLRKFFLSVFVSTHAFSSNSLHRWVYTHACTFFPCFIFTDNKKWNCQCKSQKT